MPYQKQPNGECDLLVIGSGIAGLSAALRAAAGGLSVQVIEKTRYLGGTSAMSGAGIWIPGNHIARKLGIEDSEAEALGYLRATLPEEWAPREDGLWRAFAANAHRALEFIDTHTPLKFIATVEPDPFTELPGGKPFGRQLTVKPISRWRIGGLGGRLRRTTYPNYFGYDEFVILDPYHHPVRTVLKLLPKLVYRFFTNTRGQGNALMTGMIRGCLDLGVSFSAETSAHKLCQDETGKVTGAEVTIQGGNQIITARKGVLVATGGFEWNDELRERHFPGGTKFLGSPSTNTGDGHVMVAGVGARLDHMDQANIYPCLPNRYEGRTTGLPFTFTAEKHSILVNRHGNRFVNENTYNVGEHIDARDARTGDPSNLPVWLIGDRRYLRQSIPFHWYARKQKQFLVRAKSLNDLANKTGLPVDALIKTIDRFNAFCDKGDDQDFQRGQGTWDDYKTHNDPIKLYKIENAPFVAIEVGRCILGTKGGARTDALGRVLKSDDSVIRGLYAAGLAMANPIGTRAIGAGTTLGPNLTWGFIAAETMLAGERGNGQ